MKQLLIVSPHFPPINAPDMQRVRTSLPYYEEFGWRPHVLTVDPACQENVHDQLLVRTLPDGLRVTRVRALPIATMRTLGIGNVGLRAWPYMYTAGRRVLAEECCDLVYFSTTMFASMALGRAWKREFAVPYVLDMQDPWLSTYYDDNPSVPRPPKYRLAHGLDSLLEPWTMREVGGLIAVSDDYIATLVRRYPWIEPRCCVTLPFGASPADFDALKSLDVENRHFSRNDGVVHAVYVGRGGADMAPALRILFSALKVGLSQSPQLYERLHLHFIGTDYAPPSRARKTVEPVAVACGVAERVTEETTRVSYFETLRLLADADHLVVIGSDDPQYTPSKIYPYILARRPMLAVLHDHSSAGDILRRVGMRGVTTFDSQVDVDRAGVLLERQWSDLLRGERRTPDIDWAYFERYSARELTRRQCELFDEVLCRQASGKVTSAA